MIVDCEPGTYSTGSQASCTPCPAGQSCPQADGSLNQNCTPGTYSIGMLWCHYYIIIGFLIIGRETTCVSCPAGSYCPYTDRDEVNTCELGSYSTGGQSSCTLCPAGRFEAQLFYVHLAVCSIRIYRGCLCLIVFLFCFATGLAQVSM